MKSKAALIVLLSVSTLGGPSTSFADREDHHYDGQRWPQSEWKDEYWDGPCEVKIDSKRGEFKREIKCKDGVGAHWQGEWKTEYQDGGCMIKQEATREEFKEEVKCDD